MNPPNLSRLLSLRDDNDLHAANMELHRDRFERIRTRHEDGTAPKAVAVHQLFQTPPDLAARMAALAEIHPGNSVLEPSAGLGNLLRPILTYKPASVCSVEVDPTLSATLQDMFPGLQHHAGDFLQYFPDITYDRIVMNPPFTMRSDIKHIQHALLHLSEGGVLVGLCLSSHHRYYALRSLADHWEVIPAGTFRSAGTNVETILFRIRK